MLDRNKGCNKTGYQISPIKLNLVVFIICILIGHNITYAQTDWYETETENFKILYRPSHEHLVPKIISSAENALLPLKKIFNFTPSEKIIINTYDAADFGFGAATTVPQNFIRLEIEPLESGYETVPYNDRIQWILSHELVHIVVNDHASGIENFFRSLFSKVAPEQPHPITVFYSLLTNFSRYTPRWHQEGIAVFIETWFSGGYGRILGNFDEMYFRSMVLENAEFATPLSLDTKVSHNSFLLENAFYLYGTRFCAYLAVEYGPEKLIKWFTPPEDDMYDSFVTRFEKTYLLDFEIAWADFVTNEISFQQKNTKKLSASEITELFYPGKGLFGWITQPYFSRKDSSILFGYHKPHKLAAIHKLSLKKNSGYDITSLPTPSIQQVASVAYDSELDLLFYTTNNNQLFRDIRVIDIKTNKEKLLFQDCRVGDITIASVNHDMWGIQHDEGKTTLVFSPYPYNQLIPVTGFNTGDDLSQLAISTDGKQIAAVLHRSNGEQSIIISNADSLKNGGAFRFQTVTSSGSPENPSWSDDGRYLLWSAYVNGVSNIYKINFSLNEITPVTNTLNGLFKPIFINEENIFAFEFSTEGFIPVVIQNKSAEHLPAIEYYGQKIIDANPTLTDWALKEKPITLEYEKKDYSGFANLKLQSIVPVFTGFQSQKVIGIYTHIADPLFVHDISMEFGYSPFNKNSVAPKFHFKGRYEFMKRYDFGIDHNAPDFYDLFNNRKRGMIGTKFRFGHSYYWIYDNPLKIKQTSEIALYTDYQYINDNLVKVSEPDFFVAQSVFNSKNERRSIGSSDFEEGNEINGTVMLFGSNPDDPQYAAQVFADVSNLSTWLMPHNVLHVKLGGGYHFKNDNLIQARFFFGGFGNRALENVDYKQFRSIFRFPGIPIYSLDSERFLKLLLENNFPPIRFSSAGIGQQYLNHIDISLYSQALFTKSSLGEKWIDIGAQINFIFKHWFNLESTLSAGIANAWSENSRSWEWFISYKLLKN